MLRNLFNQEAPEPDSQANKPPYDMLPTEQIVDVDSIVGDFLLTNRGDLVAILEFTPLPVSTIDSVANYDISFARLIYDMRPQTAIQIVQMPVPTDVNILTDKYASAAFAWGARQTTAAQAGDRSLAEKYARRREIAMHIGASIIDKSGNSVKLVSFVILTQHAARLNKVTKDSLAKAHDELTLDVNQFTTACANHGIAAMPLTPQKALEVLWYAYNPEAGPGVMQQLIADRFFQIADAGRPNGEAVQMVTAQEAAQAVLNPEVIPSILAPQLAVEHDDFLVFNGKRLLMYYADDFNGALPSIQRLMGPRRQYAGRLFVSMYVQAPSVDEIAMASRKTSAALQAMEAINDRMGRMRSYRQQKQIMAVEQARAGAETEENVPRLLGLYLAILTADDDQVMRYERNEFESVMRSAGVRFIPAKWNQLNTWKTMLPLGQRYHRPEDRNIFAENMTRLNPMTSETWMEADGDFCGYALLPHGSYSPVSIVRARGTKRMPSDALIGATGSGKSYAMKNMAYDWAAHGHRMAIVDPKNEWDEVGSRLGANKVELNTGRGLNLFHFQNLGIDPGSEDGKNLTRMFVEDNLNALFALYLTARGGEELLHGSERNMLTTALREAMKAKGLDETDMSTWKPDRVFLRDVYQQLAQNLQNRDPRLVNTMLNCLRDYCTEDGWYYEHFHGTLAFDLQSDASLFQFGVNAYGSDGIIQTISQFAAFRMIAQQAITSYLLSPDLKPFHIVVDEASHMLTSGYLIGTIVKYLTKLGSYNIHVHLAFQDMEAITRADERLRESNNAPTTNTLASALSTYFLFMQAPSSAEAAARTLGLTEVEASMIKSFDPGNCILLFTAEALRFPLQIMVPDAFRDDFSTSVEDQHLRVKRQLKLTPQVDADKPGSSTNTAPASAPLEVVEHQP